MSLSGQLKHGDVSKDIWQDSERACKEEDTNNLLPPFHKVMHSGYECFRANDCIAELEAEVSALKAQLREGRSHTRHTYPDFAHAMRDGGSGDE